MTDAAADDAAPAWPPSDADVALHLRHAHRVALAAVAAGHHPFGAILVGPDGRTVVMEQRNVDVVNHAESTLCRRAYAELGLSDAARARCTLYSTVEPCAMCAGTQYWAGIGGLVYGITEHRLLQLTGASDENPTMNLPCRTVFAAGQKAVRVVGPVPALEEEIAAPHLEFWTRAASHDATGGEKEAAP